MNNIKICHTADWHANNDDIEEIVTNVNYMLDICEKEKIDLFVHAGDVTDSKNLKLGSVAALKVVELFKRMSNISPVIVCLGTDSHDGLSPLQLEHISGEFPIYVSSYPEQIVLLQNKFFGINEIDDFLKQYKKDFSAIITTCPPPTKQYFQTDSSIEVSNLEIAHNLGVMFAGFGAIANQYNCCKIFVGHFQEAGAKISETQELNGRDIEVTKDQLKSTNSDFICLGHIHKAQPHYSGSIYRKTFGELDEKGFYIHEQGKESRFIEVPAIGKKVFDLDWTKWDIQGESKMFFGPNFPESDFVNCKIKINIKLWQDDIQKLNKKKMKQFLLDEGAIDCIINPIIIPREIVRNEEVNQVEKVSEKIKVLAEHRGEEIEDGIIDRIADLESGSDFNELIEKWS